MPSELLDTDFLKLSGKMVNIGNTVLTSKLQCLIYFIITYLKLWRKKGSSWRITMFMNHVDWKDFVEEIMAFQTLSIFFCPDYVCKWKKIKLEWLQLWQSHIIVLIFHRTHGYPSNVTIILNLSTLPAAAISGRFWCFMEFVTLFSIPDQRFTGLR